MAKGFMIFVEGMDAPKKVHTAQNSAWHEMQRLAELNPEKEIIIFQVYKRMKWSPEDKRAMSIGSHIPEGIEGRMVDKSELIRRKDLKPAKAKVA